MTKEVPWCAWRQQQPDWEARGCHHSQCWVPQAFTGSFPPPVENNTSSNKRVWWLMPIFPFVTCNNGSWWNQHPSEAVSMGIWQCEESWINGMNVNESWGLSEMNAFLNATSAGCRWILKKLCLVWCICSRSAGCGHKLDSVGLPALCEVEAIPALKSVQPSYPGGSEGISSSSL